MSVAYEGNIVQLRDSINIALLCSIPFDKGGTVVAIEVSEVVKKVIKCMEL